MLALILVLFAICRTGCRGRGANALGDARNSLSHAKNSLSDAANFPSEFPQQIAARRSPNGGLSMATNGMGVARRRVGAHGSDEIPSAFPQSQGICRRGEPGPGWRTNLARLG